jgi:hypothetical protein
MEEQLGGDRLVLFGRLVFLTRNNIEEYDSEIGMRTKKWVRLLAYMTGWPRPS